MKLDFLTDAELLKLASHQGSQNEYIMQEWKNRHGISFPYMVILDKIYNCILEDVVSDEDCDRLVVEQANEIRQQK